MRFVLAILLVIAVPGCTLLSIATTESELIRQDELGTRTSHHAANVDGSACYTDRHVRETHKAHVEGLFGLSGALGAILVIIAGQVQKPWGAAIAIDGTVAFGHLMIFQRRQTTDDRWLETLDTSYCNVGNVAKSADDKGKDTYEPPKPRGPATRDTDGDGLNDDVDQCTLGPEDKDGFADDDGCPDDDNDRDGIDDSRDKCPNEPEDMDGFQDTDGCPDLDNDGDGVPDSADRCPFVAEDRDGFEDGDGCIDADNDRDGIPDAADKCPNEPEDRDGYQDDDGCIDPDNDQDGVLDAADKCPAEPETKNGYKDDDGCSDELSPRVKRIVGAVAGLTFAKGTAQLTPGAAAAIARVAGVLAAEQDLHVQLDVYCDDQELAAGGDLGALADARATAVKDALAKRKIDPARITPMPMGAAAAGTKSRVELELISAIAPGKTRPLPGATP